MMFNSTQWQQDSSLETLERVENTKALVLYNDDVNSFDFVIEALVKVCKHEIIQAEQCTYLVHYKGKCAVKNGSFKELKPYCEALLERGLSAVIEN